MAAGISTIARRFVLPTLISVARGGFASLTYGLARSERQGGVVGSIVLLVMSFLGGSYIPLSQLPSSLRVLSPFTVNYWGVDGFTRILFSQAGVRDVAGNLAVLLVLFAVLTAAGGALLRRRLMGGHA